MSTTARRHPNVVRAEELEPVVMNKGTRFGFTDRWLGQATGARGVGCSLYEIEPGRSAFPAHYHTANEEALYVLDGEGTLRIGKDTVAVSAGDYVTFPAGPDHAHRLDNTGARNLKYLGLSTLHPVEIVGYPDSKKIGMRAMPAIDSKAPWLRAIVKEGVTVDYYEGEDIG